MRDIIVFLGAYKITKEIILLTAWTVFKMSLGKTKTFCGAEGEGRFLLSKRLNIYKCSIMRSILKYVLKRQLTKTGKFDNLVNMIVIDHIV